MYHAMYTYHIKPITNTVNMYYTALPDERACSSKSLMEKDLKLANVGAVEQCLRSIANLTNYRMRGKVIYTMACLTNSLIHSH